MGEQIVELGGALTDQMGEYLAFFLPAQIGAGRRRGQVELRSIAGVLGHVSRTAVVINTLISVALRAA